MSFPSAVERLEAGDSPKEAMLYAAQRNTGLGFAALQALANTAKNQIDDPVVFVQNSLPADTRQDVLRSEAIGSGVKVDFHPDSTVGRQVARLMTDAVRPLLEETFGVHFGFANCCGGIASEKKEDTRISLKQQIEWQNSIDC